MPHARGLVVLGLVAAVVTAVAACRPPSATQWLGRRDRQFALMRVPKVRATSAVLAGDGHLIIAGVAEETELGSFGIAHRASSTNSAVGFVAELDERGDVLWAQETPEHESWIGHGPVPRVALSGDLVIVAFLATGPFARAGSAPTWWEILQRPGDRPCPVRSRPVVVAFDHTGRRRWTQALWERPDVPQLFVPIAVVPDGAGGVTVSGTGRDAAAVVKLDAAGRVEWLRSLDEPGRPGDCTGLGHVSIQAAGPGPDGATIVQFFTGGLELAGHRVTEPGLYMAALDARGALLWAERVEERADRLLRGPGELVYVVTESAVVAFSARTGAREGDVYRVPDPQLHIRDVALAGDGALFVGIDQDTYGVFVHRGVAVETTHRPPYLGAAVILKVGPGTASTAPPIVLRTRDLGVEGFDESRVSLHTLLASSRRLVVIGTFEGTLLTDDLQMDVPYRYVDQCTFEGTFHTPGCDRMPYYDPSLFIRNVYF